MKFSESKYVITKETKENLQNKIDAILASRQHKPSHSLQVVLVISFGLNDKRDASCVNEEVTHDDLLE